MQIKYGAEDVEVLLAIREKQIQLLPTIPVDLTNIIQLENDVSLAFADIEYNGMQFNREKWLLVASENKEVLTKLSSELDIAVESIPKLSKFVNPYVQLDAFEDTSNLRRCTIKWSSPKQLLDVMKTYGLPVEAVNHNDLKPFRKDDFIALYLKYKEQEKAVSTYGTSFLNYVDDDGRIRTTFYQILETGRVSSGNKKQNSPNLQNIPRDNKYRNAFYAPEGYKLVTCDFSGQELKIIASGSKDPVWKAAIDNGWDLHSVCSELVYGEAWKEAAENDCEYYKFKQQCKCVTHKKMRTHAKSISFGLAYGAGPFKLAEQLEISKEDAEEIMNKYFKAFPKIKAFLESLANYGIYYGYILTYAPFRRIRWFPQWHEGLRKPMNRLSKEDKKLKGEIERMSKNSPIQGR
jgi:DNA polymerase I-like protein with 3'-5' exonuclease and polymerase domains